MAKPDWEAIETAYRAGVTCERIYNSVRESTNNPIAPHWRGFLL